MGVDLLMLLVSWTWGIIGGTGDSSGPLIVVLQLFWLGLPELKLESSSIILKIDSYFR